MEKYLTVQQHKQQHNNKHILYLVTEDWYFCSHRLALAKAALAAGYRVTVVTRVCQHGTQIQSQGIRLIPLEISRRSINPIREFITIVKLYNIYNQERPDIVHQVAIKPVLYGTLAAYLSKIPKVINAVAGLGFLFSSKRMLARILRPLVQLAMQILLSSSNSIILQNPDDVSIINRLLKLPSQRVHLILGAGVDLKIFYPTPPPRETDAGPVILFPARLLWDKGIAELVAAAKILKAKGITARYVLAGAPDLGNPATVPEDTIRAWVKDGIVEWWGQRDDMPIILQRSHIICLPSYREGLPKALAEAAACGRPIVTTDTPGCREVVQHKKNGLLVPIRNANALAQALEILILNPELRDVYGQAGRQIAESTFGSEQVITATLAIYRLEN